MHISRRIRKTHRSLKVPWCSKVLLFDKNDEKGNDNVINFFKISNPIE